MSNLDENEADTSLLEAIRIRNIFVQFAHARGLAETDPCVPTLQQALTLLPPPKETPLIVGWKQK